jgi:hypothetical protein
MPHLKRQWLNLGETSVDLSQILKIAFGKDARLFAIAGDALALSAWTDDRTQLARLRQIASPADGWINVKPELALEAEYSDSDDLEESRISIADERLCLNFVDKVIETTTQNGHALELFSAGVFVGEIFGDDIETAKEYLGL